MAELQKLSFVAETCLCGKDLTQVKVKPEGTQRRRVGEVKEDTPWGRCPDCGRQLHLVAESSPLEPKTEPEPEPETSTPDPEPEPEPETTPPSDD